MLALCYAAEHPENAGPIVLIACGTFDRTSRSRLEEILEERIDDDLRRRIDQLAEEISDRGEQLRQKYELIRPLYSYDPVTAGEHDEDTEPLDVRAHQETWSDMVRLQDEGVYPAAFAVVESPVLMLHGAYDPHPGRLIRATLAPYLPQLEYHEWDQCGHSPWLERTVREDFFALLREWLSHHLADDAPGP
jgi:pimeloyl-ACP methyl ester carboxylesterase